MLHLEADRASNSQLIWILNMGWLSTEIRSLRFCNATTCNASTVPDHWQWDLGIEAPGSQPRAVVDARLRPAAMASSFLVNQWTMNNGIQYQYLFQYQYFNGINGIEQILILEQRNKKETAATGRPQSRCWTSIADELHRLARMDHRPLERCPRPGLGHQVAMNDPWHLGKPDQMEVDAEKLHLDLLCKEGL